MKVAIRVGQRVDLKVEGAEGVPYSLCRINPDEYVVMALFDPDSDSLGAPNESVAAAAAAVLGRPVQVHEHLWSDLRPEYDEHGRVVHYWRFNRLSFGKAPGQGGCAPSRARSAAE